jgi:hypothetical protein
MRRAFLTVLTGMAAVTFAAPAAAEDAPAFGQAPVSDADLAEQRGGFTLPGGVGVSIAVQSDTSVNGVLLLRTIFVAAANSAPTLSIFGRPDAAPASGGAEAATAPAAPTAPGTGTASINNVTVNNGVAAIGQGQEGLVQLELASGGAAVEAAGGTVKLEALGRGNQVVLSLPTLDVRHLVGQAYGTIAANSGNDVSIDTSTVMNLDLANATPLNIGSALFRVDTLGMNAAAALGGR